MIDDNSVNLRISRITTAMKLVEQILEKDDVVILSDGVVLGALKYYLVGMIQGCFDIGNHLIGKMKWEKPQRYSEIFAILGKHGVFPDEFGVQLSAMASFRNRIVHLYLDLDDMQFINIVRNFLGDIETFIRYIIQFLS